MTWQQELQLCISSIPELEAALQICLPHIDNKFALRVPKSFVARMQLGDSNDPLLRQVLPTAAENKIVPGFIKDPLQEANYNPIAGLLHKYHARVLLTIASGCAINCRYCFRREFPYAANNPSKIAMQKIFTYIEQDLSINEVILSGGDPLIAKDNYLEWIIKQLEQIPHLDTIRLHTRIPIVIPNRITNEFINILVNTRLQPVIVLHCNHPNEIDNSVINMADKLRNANITLLNQSVLLAGVNDNSATLIQLSRRLFKAGILPYYLHILDKVAGSAHFEVSTENSKKIYQDILEQLPGYLVPKLVREIPGAKHKVPYCV